MTTSPMISLPSIHEMFPEHLLSPPTPRPTTVRKQRNDEERKHICPQCSKRFNRPSSLRIHMNTHTGATPFPCPFPHCGRSFNVNSNMRRHLRNHTHSHSHSTQPTTLVFSRPYTRPYPPRRDTEYEEYSTTSEDEEIQTVPRGRGHRFGDLPLPLGRRRESALRTETRAA